MRRPRSPGPVDPPESFDNFAAGYDEFVTLERRLRDDDWLTVLNLRGQRALDAGCGSGHTTVQLATSFEHVVGFDLSAPLIHIARQRRPHPRVDYQISDLADFDDPDGFDLVYSHTMLHHVADYPAALCRLRSWVRPGGTAVVIDNVCDLYPTPPRWAYTHGALRDLPNDLRRLGPRDTWRLYRFRTSEPWLAHLASDRYLSRTQFRQLYNAVLPGARFHDLGFALAAIWTDPRRPPLDPPNQPDNQQARERQPSTDAPTSDLI